MFQHFRWPSKPYIFVFYCMFILMLSCTTIKINPFRQKIHAWTQKMNILDILFQFSQNTASPRRNRHSFFPVTITRFRFLQKNNGCKPWWKFWFFWDTKRVFVFYSTESHVLEAWQPSHFVLWFLRTLRAWNPVGTILFRGSFCAPIAVLFIRWCSGVDKGMMQFSFLALVRKIWSRKEPRIPVVLQRNLNSLYRALIEPDGAQQKRKESAR